MTRTWILALAVAATLAGTTHGQSLWTAPGSTERGLLADHVARSIGDVLTVVVRENLRVQDDGKVQLSRETELDAAIENLDIAPNAFDPLPAVKYSGTRTLDGEAKYSQNGRFETTISAVVVDVKPNGTLLVEGYRTIVLDGDFKRMHVRGLVRPIDILSNNTISSDRVANADVFYDTEGPRSYNTEKNWFEILLDWVWPF